MITYNQVQSKHDLCDFSSEEREEITLFLAGVAMAFGHRHNSEGFRQSAHQTVDRVAGLTQCEPLQEMFSKDRMPSLYKCR